MKAGKRRPYPRFKLWISSEEAEGVFGDGKWRLLKAIAEHGAINAASRSLGISYRKAWGDLSKAEKCLGQSFVERHRGGVGGGQAILTDVGRMWLEAYSRFRSEVEQTVSKAFGSHIEPLLRQGKSG